MSSLVLPVDDVKFQSAVLESDRPVVVDFWAAWCPPCRVISRVLAELAAERPDVAFVEVDVEASPLVTMRYGVLAMPTLIIFRGGEEVQRLVGSRPKRRLSQELDAALTQTVPMR